MIDKARAVLCGRLVRRKLLHKVFVNTMVTCRRDSHICIERYQIWQVANELSVNTDTGLGEHGRYIGTLFLHLSFGTSNCGI